MQTYEGSCHCGAVAFSVETALDSLGACNCSRCRRLNWVMQSVPADKVTFLRGEDTLRTYRFNTRTIAHLFCPECGIQPLARGEDGKGNQLYMINVNCLEGAKVDPDAIAHWDGASF